MRAMLRERGQTSAEYVGVILVVAAVIALVATSSIGEAVTTKLTCAIQGIGGGAGCGGTAPGEGAPTPAENGAAPQEGGPPPAEPSAAPLEAEAPAESPPEEEDDDDGGFGGFVSDAWNGTTDAVGDLGTGAWNGTKAFGTGAWNGTKALGGELWDTTKEIGRHVNLFDPSGTWEQWKETGGTAGYAITHPWASTKAVAGSFVDPIKEAYEHGGIPEALGRGTIDAVGAIVGGKGLTKLGKLNRVDDAVPDAPRARDTTPDADRTPGERPPDSDRDRADDCSNSFTAGTPVLLADGSKRAIAAVAVGDRVLAGDPRTGATGARAIERVIVGEGRKVLVRVRVSGEVLTATDHHPVWVEGRGDYVEAEDLRPGERLRRPDGSLTRVEDVRILLPEEERVYNLTVAGMHTYYAGARPILVHNTHCEEVSTRTDPAARRVTLRKDTEEAIQEAAPKTPNGDYIDPNTRQVIPKEGPFDYGHRPGFEWRTTQRRARDEGWSRERLIEYENDPSHYQIEDPSSNRGHRYERPREAE